MRIEYRGTETLAPYAQNTKKHDQKQIENVANSIRRFGWQQPIVIDENDVVVIGHCRLLAAKQLGMTEVPVTVASGLTDEEIRELRIADNRTNESPWDMEMLEKELADLDFEGFDLDFDSIVQTTEEATQNVAEDDYEAEPPKTPRAKIGDIYQLGNHRLMCGSSTNIEDVEKLMNGDTARMLFTSPPYSDMREYEGGKNLDVDNIALFIATYRLFTDYQCVNLGIQRKNHEIYPYWDRYIEIAKDSGYKLMSWNVWDKMTCGSIGQQSAFFPIRHEWVFVFGTEFYEINLTWAKKEESIHGKRYRKVRQADGSMKVSSKGDETKPYKQMESVLQLLPEMGAVRSQHPATFPVGLPAEYIKSMSDEGDIVIEPFCGSGTTLIACEQLGRCCYGMELEPKYVDVIINRWEQLTGEKAVLLNG